MRFVLWMLLWLLSAVILLLFHIKGPMSHWLYEVQCFYFSKNKKVTKRYSCASQCHNDFQESRRQTLVFQPGGSFCTDWAALTHLSFCIMWTPQHRLICHYNKLKMLILVTLRLKEIFVDILLSLTMITLNLKIIV